MEGRAVTVEVERDGHRIKGDNSGGRAGRPRETPWPPAVVQSRYRVKSGGRVENASTAADGGAAASLSLFFISVVNGVSNILH